MIIQDVTSTQNHTISKLAQTRWLSRVNVISAVLEQYEALRLFFQSEKTDVVDKDITTRSYNTLTNCGTRHMLLFLSICFEEN